MEIRNILFDLDGTLLPLDPELFKRVCFKLLTKKLLPYGYEPNVLIDGVLASLEAERCNDGSRSNNEVFWQCFSEMAGKRVMLDRDVFEEFFRVDFQRASSSCRQTLEAKATIERCKELGFRVVVAAQPVLPAAAVESELRWTGIDPASVDYITSSENCAFCRPQEGYFRELLRQLNAKPEECLMVGNDVAEDICCAEAIGMQTFLLTDCLINPENETISRWKHGSFALLNNDLSALAKR